MIRAFCSNTSSALTFMLIFISAGFPIFSPPNEFERNVCFMTDCKDCKYFIAVPYNEDGKDIKTYITDGWIECMTNPYILELNTGEVFYTILGSLKIEHAMKANNGIYELRLHYRHSHAKLINYLIMLNGLEGTFPYISKK